MKIAYLINQYPKISLSFIRREIAGLEASGIEVTRFSIRLSTEEVVDEADKLELEKTQIILGAGIAGLLSGLLQAVVAAPLRFWQALKLTGKMGWGSERGMIRHLAYLAEACVLRRWSAEREITHIHAHFGTNPAAVAMLCRVLGGPTYSFTVHGPEEFDKAQAISLTEKIKRAAFVVAVSSFGKSQLYRWCEYKQWSKIHAIHCGVDEMFLAQPYVPLPTEPRFACVARLSEQKGHLLLIEAVCQLAAEELKFKVVLVGDGPLRDEIEALIDRFHLKDYIEITGWATNSEVQHQILASQVMVLPSFAEGLPVVIMEALALSRPVISTYIAGIPELVEPDKCGWLVPSGSAEALASAMRAALLSSVEELAAMGKLGAKRVAQAHNAALEAQKLAALFQRYDVSDRSETDGE